MVLKFCDIFCCWVVIVMVCKEGRKGLRDKGLFAWDQEGSCRFWLNGRRGGESGNWTTRLVAAKTGLSRFFGAQIKLYSR